MVLESLSFYFSNLSISQEMYEILKQTIYGFIGFCFSRGVYLTEKENTFAFHGSGWPLYCFFLWPLILPFYLISRTDSNSQGQSIKYALRLFPYGFIICFLVFGAHFTYSEITMSPEQKVARAEKIYQTKKKIIEDANEYKIREAEAKKKAIEDANEHKIKEAKAKKKAIEDANEYKIKEAKAQIKLAKLEAKQRELYRGNLATDIKPDKQLAKIQSELNSLQARGESSFYHKLSHLIFDSPEQKVAKAERIYQAKKKAIEDADKYKIKVAKAQIKLAKAQAELDSLQSKRADYYKLSQATISSSKSEPVNEQTKLILSALWLGACFFLQRLFERLFHDKGYALLTVCAAGFLLAFFTANYFLLGGSVTGGIMGSVGDRA